MKKKPQSMIYTIIGMLVAAVVWYFNQQETGPASTTVSSSGEYEKIEGCKLIDHKWNDGDSFYIDNGSKKIHYRLYYVDTPESAYKTYPGGDNNGKRLDEQGEYFGGLSRDETAAVGVASKKFVLKLLSKNNFTLLTKNEPVTNRADEERIHAFVLVKHEGREIYLHELLMEQGLARLKTRGVPLPEGRDYHQQKKHLQSLEKVAKSKRLGAWSH